MEMLSSCSCSKPLAHAGGRVLCTGLCETQGMPGIDSYLTSLPWQAGAVGTYRELILVQREMRQSWTQACPLGRQAPCTL